MYDKILFGDVVRKFLPKFVDIHNPIERIKNVLTNLSQCGTEAMGRCTYHCWDCEHEDSFNLSCRNRHCPSCHTHHKEQWLEARMGELLPVQYFHVVFTIPDILNPAMMGHMAEGYRALFKAALETLKTFGEKKGVQLGMTMVLHTWGSNLSYHPHIHVLVPGGGINLKTNKWVNLPVVTSEPEDTSSTGISGESLPTGKRKENHPFLFPVRALSKVFRSKFIQYLTEFCGHAVLDSNTREECFRKGFVVYAKAPAAGPEQVLNYIARYSYGIAISNSRITGINDEDVTFKYKDYKDGVMSKEMSLRGEEFLRRFSMHILPKHFTRIRHCGFLAPSNREKLRNTQHELEHLSGKAAETAKERERKSLMHALHCEICHSRRLHISIGYKKENSYASIIPKIRSPSPY